MNESPDETLRDAAMEYHRQPTAGKNLDRAHQGLKRRFREWFSSF
jgi:hypothetical protein